MADCWCCKSADLDRVDLDAVLIAEPATVGPSRSDGAQRESLRAAGYLCRRCGAVGIERHTISVEAMPRRQWLQRLTQ
jgi:hypothetical protein